MQFNEIIIGLTNNGNTYNIKYIAICYEICVTGFLLYTIDVGNSI